MSRPLASVVVPAYNEGPELGDNLAALARHLSAAQSPYDYEIIVVDDGSTDETYETVQAAEPQIPGLRVVRHASNRGMGSAIRTGFAFAEGCVAVVYDSDLSYAPEIIPRLLEQLDRNGDDLVLASPYMRGGKVANVPLLRRFLSREANRFLCFATNGRYATLTCMVRAYRLSFFRNVPSTEPRMEVNPELVFAAIKSGARVSEIPAVLQWSPRRAKARAGLNVKRTLKQIARTVRYGVSHRPAILLAIPGIMPGVLPLMLTIMVLLHLSLATIAMITAITMVIQNVSLALFAGQLAVFGRNTLRSARADVSTTRR
ncbi:MAG TPA: glycosyltransferase family 2 protein [Candidatus Baltobacteraceae bacterium]|jgi:glycosyltransferase involved in cell wall biosynthesis|nr:glycosyltransferase family 2 protein [Candidatus Baltobacteraceae bacterium]